MPISLDSALAFLENRGFENKKQNIRLLKRANFNPELVANFLSAKKALQIATSSDDSKPFALRRKLAKQTQPELFAKFIEAKKALHTGNYSSEESEKQLSKNAKRCLTKEEKIAFREQRLQSKLQQQNSKKEEETSDEEISAPAASIETNEEKEPKRRLTKEERISRKLQRIQMKVAQNKDLSLKTEEKAEDNEGSVPTASQVVQETPKSGRLSKEERLARKESRLKLKLLKLSQQHQQAEEEEPQEDSVVNTKHRRCGKLTKEERLARKEERLKLKEIRLNLKEQKLAKRQGYHIPPRVTSVFIDGSSMSSKTQNEIEDIAKNIIEKNAQLAKVTILYEGVDVASVSSGKLVIASATPLFDSVEDAVKVLSSRIADKKTFTVISGNKTWVQALRNDSVNAIVPF